MLNKIVLATAALMISAGAFAEGGAETTTAPAGNTAAPAGNTAAPASNTAAEASKAPVKMAKHHKANKKEKAEKAK